MTPLETILLAAISVVVAPGVVSVIVMYSKLNRLEYQCGQNDARQDHEIEKLRDKCHDLSNEVQKLKGVQ